MKASLVPGIEATKRIEIDRPRTIGFMGEAARVYATPALVRDVEAAASELLRAHLDDGESTVGARVEIDHLGATLLGMSAEISVRVAAVDGRQVSLEFDGRDSVEPICRGRHTRLVVDAAGAGQRLAAKAAQARKA
jgi:predicted thioesterase